VHRIRLTRGLAWSLALSWAAHAAILAAVASVWLGLDGAPGAPIVVDLAEEGAPAMEVRAARPAPRPAAPRPAAAPPPARREPAPATTPDPSEPATEPTAAAPPPGGAPAAAVDPPASPSSTTAARPAPPLAGAAAGTGAGAGLVAPQPTERAAPRYPEPARLAGLQGTVVLRARVTAEGAVAEVVIDRSTGSAELDTAAVEALRRWRFEPARRAGQPVEVWILVPIQFSLG
jgi:protein TonB